MIADMVSNKKLNQIVTCFYHSILFCSAKRCYIKHYTFFLLRKFQIKKSFKKSHLIIHQILALKTL